MKVKIGKLNYIKNFCTSKGTINRAERQPVNEKMPENGPSDKRSISRIYKELPQLSHNQNIIQFKRQAKDLNGYFSKEDSHKGPIISTRKDP